MTVRRHKKTRMIFTHCFMVILCAIVTYPVLWWVFATFKDNSELTAPSLLPRQWILDNYVLGWNALPKFSFSHFFVNSFMVVGTIVVLAVLVCSFVAFGFARVRFPLRKMWFAILLTTLMLPSQIIIVPQYIMYNSLGWVDTYLPFIVPHLLACGNGSAFFIYMLIQFIRGIPRELDESAKMDGCTLFGIYARIIIPLTSSALISVAIFAFMWNWDDFFLQTLYLNSLTKFTVGLALKFFIDGESAAPWGQLLAMSLVSVFPGIIIFFLAQKYFVEGITTGALKG